MNRKQLLAALAADRGQVRAVEVDGWGTVHVRDMTVAMVDKLNTARKREGDQAINMIAASAAALLCDADGNYLFDPGNPDDLALLGAAGFAKLSKVIAAGNEGQAETPAGN